MAFLHRVMPVALPPAIMEGKEMLVRPILTVEALGCGYDLFTHMKGSRAKTNLTSMSPMIGSMSRTCQRN